MEISHDILGIPWVNTYVRIGLPAPFLAMQCTPEHRI